MTIEWQYSTESYRTVHWLDWDVRLICAGWWLYTVQILYSKIWVTAVAQQAKAPGIHYVAASIPAVTPSCTKENRICSSENHHCTEAVVFRILWSYPASSIELMRLWNRLSTFRRCGVPLSMKKKNIGDKIIYQYGSFEPGFNPC